MLIGLVVMVGCVIVGIVLEERRAKAGYRREREQQHRGYTDELTARRQLYGHHR